MVDVVHGFVALNPPERFGSHVLLARLGAGGMGTVYLAARPSELGDGHVVALKRLELPYDDPRARSSFVDEVRIVARLSHPCIARMLDAGQSDSRAWIAMELVLGETLGTAISGVPTTLRALFAARALAHACEGLHAAHELCDDHGQALSVVHRDISPDNIMVGFDGFTRVLDFGVAHALGQSQRTATGELKGKARYAAPEQIEGGGVDRRTDVWGLGVVLWEALTGAPLFPQRNLRDLLLAVADGPIPGVRERAPHVPWDLDELVAKALARDPARRFDDARSMGRALEQFLLTAETAYGSAEVSETMHSVFAASYASKQAQARAARRWLMERVAG